MIFHFGSQAVSLWAWLGPVLLFGASLVASGVAYFGIRKSNATNEAAINAADKRAIADRNEQRERDFRTWQRDTLLRVGASAMEAAFAVEERYRAITYERLPTDVPSHLDGIEVEANRLSSAFFTLRLVGVHEVADRCRDIRDALGQRHIQMAALDGHRAFREMNDQDPGATAVVAVLRGRLDTLLEPATRARGEFGDAVENELRRINLPALPDESAPSAPVDVHGSSG